MPGPGPGHRNSSVAGRPGRRAAGSSNRRDLQAISGDTRVNSTRKAMVGRKATALGTLFGGGTLWRGGLFGSAGG
jgi:hypothetical protein